MATSPNTQNKAQPERNRSRIARYAVRIGASVLALAGVAALGEMAREFVPYELKQKPTLQDKARSVNDHQKNLAGIVEDIANPKGSIFVSPYNRAQVKKLRAVLKKDGSLEKLVPAEVTHEEFKDSPGSFTAVNFSSEGSRQATVKALTDTIKSTSETKLDRQGLDKIYDTYGTELTEELAAAAQKEEALISSGAQSVVQDFSETFDDKPMMVDAGYDYALGQSIDLTSGPSTVEEAASQLPGSPSPESLLPVLPQRR